MAQSWPLVGRDDEIARIERAFSETVAGAFVLAGAAGVGKTRLAADIAARAAARGWIVERLVATRSIATVPFGAFAPLLAPRSDAPASRFDALASATDDLRTRGRGRPLLLTIDDAHLLDDGSAALVHQLAVDHAVYLLATVRTDEPAPASIVALWKDGVAERIEIQAMADAQVAELMRVVLHDVVEPATLRRLTAAVRGNMLYLREFVLEGLASGALARRGGRWEWLGPLAGGDRLAELVAERLRGLPDDVRSVVEILAIGEPIGVEAMTALTSRDALERAEHAGFVVVDHDGHRRHLRLSHPVYAEALRTRIGALRAQSIAAALARELAATGARRREDLLRAATWQLDAGSPGDPILLAEASVRALGFASRELAETFARAAVDAGGGHPALVELARAVYWSGRSEEVVALLTAAEIDRAEPRERAIGSVTLASAYLWGRGDYEQAEAVLARAEAASAADDPWVHEVRAHRANILFLVGRVDDAQQLAQRILADDDVQDRARVQALSALLLALAVRGRVDDAAAVANEALALAARLADELQAELGGVFIGSCLALLLAGRFSELDGFLGTLHELALTSGTDDLRGLWAMMLGRSAIAQGRLDIAVERYRESIPLLRLNDPGRILSWACAGAATAYGMLGLAGEAEAMMRECDASAVPAIRCYSAETQLARAWAAAAAGEVSRALTLAANAAAVARDLGQHGVEALALHEAVRIGAGGPTAGRLALMADGLQGSLFALFVRHAHEFVAGDTGALVALADRCEEYGLPLLAAEASARAATRFRADGRSGAAATAAQRARTLAAECGAPRTPALREIREASSVAVLTRREHEVAELAASGMTKRDIAQRLTLSIRTVGNHLNHVYGKLNVESRDQLRAVLDLATPAPE